MITPTESGCHLLTEETQQESFFLEELGRNHPGALCRYHQEWVEALARGRGGREVGLAPHASASGTGSTAGSASIDEDLDPASRST